MSWHHPLLKFMILKILTTTFFINHEILEYEMLKMYFCISGTFISQK